MESRVVRRAQILLGSLASRIDLHIGLRSGLRGRLPYKLLTRHLGSKLKVPGFILSTGNEHLGRSKIY
jgi:hypothetical protein